MDKLDTDSPTSEGICQAYVQVMDYFERSEAEDLETRFDAILEARIPEATVDHEQNEDIRGGPFLLGAFHRRAWSVDWESLPDEVSKRVDPEDVAAFKDRECHLILQWVDLLPFAIVLVRATPGPKSEWLQHLADGLLDGVLGRLGPSNVYPRSAWQFVIYAKVTEARMKRLQEAMEAGDHDDQIGRDIAEALQYVGNASGSLYLEEMGSNILHAEGDGSRFLGDDAAPEGPFRAYLFSSGRMGPQEAWKFDVPLWIPSGTGTGWSHGFDFHPVLRGAIREARHVGVELGILDEQLSRLSARLPGFPGGSSASQVPVELHPELVSMHASLQALGTELHLSSTRTPIPDETEDHVPSRRIYEIRDDDGWRMLESAWPPSAALKDEKRRTEADTRDVLEGLQDRLDRALDLVTVAETRQLNRSMRAWMIATAVLALVAVLIAIWGPG